MEGGRYMDEAMGLAREALAAGEVPIGCVLVDTRSGSVVSRGRNATNATRNPLLHAELVALLAVPAGVPPAALALHVTIEPCIMCAAALRRWGVGRVYYGAANERFGGCGSVAAVHAGGPAGADAPVECAAVGGRHRREAVEMLRAFYLQQNDRAPAPRSKRARVFKPLEQ